MIAIIRRGVTWVVFAGLMFLSGDLRAQAPAVEPGVSAALAQWRAARVKDLSYVLSFAIRESRDSAVGVGETMSFRLTENKAPLQLDFRQGGSELPVIEVNGASIGTDYRSEHIVIPVSALHEGVNEIRFRFRSKGLPLNRNADFLYTLLVPDKARSLFICMDQPDCKAVYRLSLELPRGWAAMANGSLKDTVGEGDRRIWRFEPSDKLSTYLFSFCAGRFVAVKDIQGGRRMDFLYRETDSSKIRPSVPAIFALHRAALDFMKQYTGITYPFQKIGFVAIPDFQFGGMEHPGVVQYKASSLFLDSGATREQVLGRGTLISHETAHMWFGDLVTMRWFNDVWMKEVFANFMADKIGNITMPDGKYDLKFLTDHYANAYSIDRTKGAHPIRQRLDNLEEAGALYGNIIYHKAPIMMRQLELLMGVDSFRNGLREYLARYAGRNADWPDLISILGRHTHADLVAWNRVWVNESGRPRFSYWLQAEKGHIRALEISQRGEDGTERVWPQRFSVLLVYRDRTESLPVLMNKATVEVIAAAGKPAPEYILFNSDGLGYGVFPMDEGVKLEDMRPPSDAVTRGSVYINLYENMLDGAVVDPGRLLTMYRFALGMEDEELLMNVLSDRIGSIYWRWLSPGQRDSLAPVLEEELWQAMEHRERANEKKLLWRAYNTIVLSRTGLDRLYQVWSKQQAPSGVRLTEDDYTGLAATLALRDYPGSEGMLAEQGNRIKDKDRKERWSWLLPSLSSDPVVRDAFFARLRSADGRKKETWVLTGLGYLHHPLRVGISEKYLPEMLNLLDEVKRTGDIFFPQGWLQAGFSWYTSASAAKVVTDFLEAHPDYNEKLRAKILQATDLMMRRL